MSRYQVHYMRPAYFSCFILGQEKPTLAELATTHVELMTVEAHDLEAVFAQMQGEVWSPNGEARSMILGKGLKHTSMSVGDVAKNLNTGRTFVVSTFGFEELKR